MFLAGGSCDEPALCSSILPTTRIQVISNHQPQPNSWPSLAHSSSPRSPFHQVSDDFTDRSSSRPLLGTTRGNSHVAAVAIVAVRDGRELARVAAALGALGGVVGHDEGAGLAAGALGDAGLVQGDGLAHGAPPLVLDEGVGGLEGRAGEGQPADGGGAGGADEGEEGGDLDWSC